MLKKLFSLGSSLFGNKIAKKKNKETFVDKLLKEDTNVSMMNFFLLATLGVGVVLLIVPVIGMLVDIWYNHTMTINLSDMAVYLGGVAGIFASGGLSTAWTEWSYAKYNTPVITEEDMARREEVMEAIDNSGSDEEFERD